MGVEGDWRTHTLLLFCVSDRADTALWAEIAGAADPTVCLSFLSQTLTRSWLFCPSHTLIEQVLAVLSFTDIDQFLAGLPFTDIDQVPAVLSFTDIDQGLAVLSFTDIDQV